MNQFHAQPLSPSDCDGRDRLLKLRSLTVNAPASASSPGAMPVADPCGVVRLDQAEPEPVLDRVVHTIRHSLDLSIIFATATREIAQLLHSDRVTIAQYLPAEHRWRVVADDHQNPELPNILGMDMPDLQTAITARLKQLKIVQIRHPAAHKDEIMTPFAQVFPGAWLVVPLQFEQQLWGGITVMSRRGSPWQATELERVRKVADQLAIAIHQSQSYREVQRLNAELEQQVQFRTAQLQLVSDLESTLKRITDKVRDSLDEHQILQSAVEELTRGLGIWGCNAALFDLEQGTSSICYEYTTLPSPSQRRVSRMADFPELYGQLLRREHFQFCSLLPNPIRGRVAVLCCPILGDRGTIGGLWLIDQSESQFSEPDIRLVQQVANQCAIALRQARLYQAAQAQVTELERLNQLKDDFLSTVSHELRTPMASIKMAIEMLEILLLHNDNADRLTLEPPAFQKVKRYFQFLKTGCQQEISLIDDLLDLTRIDADMEPPHWSNINLTAFVTALAQLFHERCDRQQQQLIIDLPPSLPLLTTELISLERALAELLNNACKYTPAGETITIAAQLAPLPPTQPTTLCLSVTNSGVEIPPSEYERIFERFYRIPNSDPWKHGGTGLGLALVQKLMHRLRGSIQVDSGNGKTRFVIQLPLS